MSDFHVFGSAGHVDHGKSALLRALTGMEPDRLPEEKKRGMTLDLNFVWAQWGDLKIGFVDVPGHQRFVKNMITGAAAIDGFLFVVAADDGWMPQSQEHWDVLKTLGVRRGIVVITKADRVNAERVREVRSAVVARFPSDTPVLVSAYGDSQGTERIRKEITELAQTLPKPIQEKAPRIWVDRVFSPKGQGTVVTGTLREGPLLTGQDLYHGNRKLSVRQIQQYQIKVDRAEPVARVAIQLKDPIERGALLEGIPSVSVRVVDVSLHFFDSVKKGNRQSQFHFGSSKWDVRVVPMEAEFARLKFSETVRLRFGDRFLLRNEEKTIAGGLVVDAQPIERSHKKSLEYLRTWRSGCTGTLNFLIARSGFIDLEAFEKDSIWTRDEIHEIASDEKFLKLGSRRLLDRAKSQERLNQLLKEMIRLNQPVPKTRLLKLGRQFWNLDSVAMSDLLSIAEHLRKIRRQGDLYLLPSHSRIVEPWEKECRELLEKALAKIGGRPLNLRDLPAPLERVRKVAQLAPELFTALEPEYWMGASAYQTCSERIRQHLRDNGEATLGELKGLLGLSRKPTLLLLERMDRDRMTYLKDGVRRLLGNIPKREV